VRRGERLPDPLIAKIDELFPDPVADS